MEAYRLLRLILGINQHNLAMRAGISVRELSRVEKGEVMPKREAVRALDKAFAEFILERAKSATQEPA